MRGQYFLPPRNQWIDLVFTNCNQCGQVLGCSFSSLDMVFQQCIQSLHVHFQWSDISLCANASQRSWLQGVIISSFLIPHCSKTLPRQSDAEACSVHRAERQERQGCRNASWTTLSPQCFSSSKQMAPLHEWPGHHTSASRTIECLGRVCF